MSTVDLAGVLGVALREMGLSDKPAEFDSDIHCPQSAQADRHRGPAVTRACPTSCPWASRPENSAYEVCGEMTCQIVRPKPGEGS